MNEWARLVDRYAAELKKYEDQRFGQSLTDGIKQPSFNDVRFQANQPAMGSGHVTTEAFLQKYPNLAPLVAKLHRHLQKGTDYADMTTNLKINDTTNSGFCQRDDFFNSVFDAVKGLRPAELM